MDYLFNKIQSSKLLLLSKDAQRLFVWTCLLFMILPAPNYSQTSEWQTAYDTIPSSPDTLRFKMLKNLFEKSIYSSPDFNLKLIAELEKINKGLTQARLSGEIYDAKGTYHSYHGDIDSSLNYFRKARDAFNKSGQRNREAGMINSIGIILRKKGAYNEALEHHSTALNIFEELEDSAYISKTHNGIGNVYFVLGDKQKAAEQYRIVLAYSKQVGNEASVADALSNIAVTLDDEEERIDLNLQAVAIYKKLNMTYKMMASLENIGHAYHRMGKYEQALAYYEGLKPLVKEIKSGIFTADLFRDIGATYSRMGKHSKAIPSIQQAAFLYDSLGRQYDYVECLSVLHHSQADSGNFADAYETLHEYKMLDDSLKSLEVLQNISELETKYETEKKDKEIALLSKNAELDQVKNTRLWIILISSALLGVLLFWLQRTRMTKQKAIEMEKRKVAELKNQQLNQELDFKKKELTSKVLQLCRKNEFLNDLAKQIKELKTSTVSDQQLNKLGHRINRDIDTDADWTLFLQSFETVHPDFNKKIVEVHPDLTSGEHRMACLMKMNLDSKEVANLLNISLEGVKKARYRMRKKLNLDSSENLNTYFLRF